MNNNFNILNFATANTNKKSLCTACSSGGHSSDKSSSDNLSLDNLSLDNLKNDNLKITGSAHVKKYNKKHKRILTKHKTKHPETVEIDINIALKNLTTKPDECAEDVEHAIGSSCATKKILKAITLFAKNIENDNQIKENQIEIKEEDENLLLPTDESPESIAIRKVADALGCESESCVISHPSILHFVESHNILTKRHIMYELETRYKAPGPRNNLGLLSNFNIDETLQRWARIFPEFFPCPFAMMDFDYNGDFFGNANITSILEGNTAANLGPSIGKVKHKFSCFGCVVNTDNSTGPGKHWVATFVDCRPELGTPWSVEYFDSGGLPPPRPIIGWMEKTREKLFNYRNTKIPNPTNVECKVLSVPVTNRQHQESRTECGVYALFYIRRRLENISYNFFRNQLIPDDAMTIFRTHLFRDS